MNPLLKIILRLAIVFAVIFAVIQPYNWLCQIGRSCEPFHFSYYYPKKEGIKPITLRFVVQNYRKDLDFAVDQEILETVSGRKNNVIFRAKNLSNRVIHFRPKLQVRTEAFAKYLTRYECPCSNSYKLKKGEEIELKMRFMVDLDDSTKEENLSLERGAIVAEILYKIK